uniref:Uncharacterized protein n=1 Tax=Arundo donax TaxID=35708 RepID=A0A0A8YG98_ARUDO
MRLSTFRTHCIDRPNKV